MILKVLTIDTEKIIRNGKSTSEILDGRIQQEKELKNKRFYVFSAYIDINPDQYGIGGDDGNSSSLSEDLAARQKRLIKIRFMIVDSHSKNVYYDGRLEEVKQLLSQLFDINHKNIRINANIDEFERIRKMRIKSKNVGQMSQNDLISVKMDGVDMIEDLVENDGSIESSIYEVNFVREGAIIKRDRFKEIVNDVKSNLRSITVEGFDSEGHEIRLSSAISKKISILEKESSWEDKRNLPLENILNALLKEVN